MAELAVRFLINEHPNPLINDRVVSVSALRGRIMQWPSKRKQQLGNARDTKRQKQQPENPREDQQGRETQDDVLNGGDREPDPDCSDENGENLGPDGFIADGADPTCSAIYRVLPVVLNLKNWF